MAELAGEADVYLNGKFIDTFPGVSLETGGWQRVLVETSRGTHFTKKRVSAKLEIEHTFGKGDSIKDLDVEGGVIQVKWGSGQTHVLKNAFRTDPTTLGGGEGKAKSTFNSDPAEEIT